MPTVDRRVHQPYLVLVAAVVVVRLRFGDHHLRRVEREVTSQLVGRWHPELIGGLDHQPGALVVRHVPPRAGLRQIQPVAPAIAQWSELGLDEPRALVDEAQQTPVDVTHEVRHRCGAPGQQYFTVGIGEHQQGTSLRVGGVRGFEFARQHVQRPQRADGAVRRGVVAAVEVGRAAGEATAAEFIVFEPVEVGVPPSGRDPFCVGARTTPWGSSRRLKVKLTLVLALTAVKGG